MCPNRGQAHLGTVGFTLSTAKIPCMFSYWEVYKQGSYTWKLINSVIPFMATRTASDVDIKTTLGSWSWQSRIKTDLIPHRDSFFESIPGANGQVVPAALMNRASQEPDGQQNTNKTGKNQTNSIAGCSRRAVTMLNWWKILFTIFKTKGYINGYVKKSLPKEQLW